MIDLPIKTKRLVIRRFVTKDMPAYLELMLDPESTKYLAFDHEQKTRKGATELFNFVLSSYESDQVIHAYAIALANTDEYVGSCGFSPYQGSIVECYYTRNPQHQRQGYGFEAITALLKSLKASPSVTEIRAYSNQDNIASINLAKKLGMDYLGNSVHLQSGLEGVFYRIKC
ncbi:MAG: GNAT family N-acetyltransferase [Moorea sp. SIO1G6]|uniref:GNAT family N-acetyltransferase n=1 Tax=Moorena sp. SIO1G6 TaxID=2607840 RepID=UPI0013BFDD58|nr:GNAT family N-acetyltransferase [Moorena sp. SIO1G6]NET66973.1 GNAT family N-acetyltransferase [Moorena sp. SIO1G6]